MWPCDMKENSQIGNHVAISQHMCMAISVSFSVGSTAKQFRPPRTDNITWMNGEMVVYLINGEMIQAQLEKTY